MMRRVLVTGAGGFVGAHLCARLASDGWAVVAAVSDRPGADSRLRRLGVEADVVPVDLRAEVPTARLAVDAAADAVFLLAAARSGGPGERAGAAAVNAMSPFWLVDALSPSCRVVVRLGSSTEYQESDEPMGEDTPLRPRGLFGATKAAGSLLAVAAAEAKGIRSAVLRAFQVYGPLDHPGRLVPTALRCARTAEVLPLTAPGLRRDWVHVDDVVSACLLAAEADSLPPGQVLNIGTGRQVANEELVAEVARAAGRPVHTSVGEHPGRSWDAASWVCDPTLAAELLGWHPQIALETGLAACWSFEQAEARA